MLIKISYSKLFQASLLLLLFYESLFYFFKLDGFSAGKVANATLLYIGIFFIFYLSFDGIVGFIRKNKLLFLVLIVLFTYSILKVFQSLNLENFINLFGVHHTAYSLFPFIAILLAKKHFYVDSLKDWAKTFLVLGFILMPFSFISWRATFLASPFVQISYLMLPFWFRFNKKEKFLIIIGLLCTILVAIMQDTRSILLRLFWQCSIFMIIYFLTKSVQFKILFIFIIFIFSIFLLSNWSQLEELYYTRNISVAGKEIDNDNNRVWMYLEVFENLEVDGDMTFGKGALGRYYSDFYSKSQQKQETYRYNIEVGFLTYLLKGGWFLVLLTYILFTWGIIRSFFSTDFSVKFMGFTILGHLLINFVENTPKFLAYDIIIWLFVGVCILKK